MYISSERHTPKNQNSSQKTFCKPIKLTAPLSTYRS
jgi:hypothetical protein